MKFIIIFFELILLVLISCENTGLDDRASCPVGFIKVPSSSDDQYECFLCRQIRNEE